MIEMLETAPKKVTANAICYKLFFGNVGDAGRVTMLAELKPNETLLQRLNQMKENGWETENITRIEQY